VIEITRKDNYTFDDCNKNLYEFKTNDLIVHFYQSGNRDLYFTIFPHPDNTNNIHKLSINKYKNFLLYKQVDELYKDITNLERWEHQSTLLEDLQSKLFNGEYISWESDDLVSIDSEKKEYNYLNIRKKEDEYILEFINNSKRSIFSISFNTDRSKYRMFAFAFYTFLGNLKEVTEEVHQIDFEEYIITKKLLKEKK